VANFAAEFQELFVAWLVELVLQPVTLKLLALLVDLQPFGFAAGEYPELFALKIHKKCVFI
jgi:hypothetical protein